MPITVTTHQEVFLVEHDTLAGMLRETADLVDELQRRHEGKEVEIELEVGLIGCRLSHGIRVFYRAETDDSAEPGLVTTSEGGDEAPSDQTYPALVRAAVEPDGVPT